ncbi:hypothetical protein [Janibacter alittae]|uniref:Uncharacterized protein n=1 Tax=Janibacter alittae TaxID=3115209 RepID=A0ABZ2MI77_9MICO
MTGSTSPDTDGGSASATSAIDAAEAETGGTAYAVDDENGSWEIDLAKDARASR